jgi:hypothetical protein
MARVACCPADRLALLWAEIASVDVTGLPASRDRWCRYDASGQRVVRFGCGTVRYRGYNRYWRQDPRTEGNYSFHDGPSQSSAKPQRQGCHRDASVKGARLSAQIEIKGEGGHVLLTILDYERADVADLVPPIESSYLVLRLIEEPSRIDRRAW